MNTCCHHLPWSLMGSLPMLMTVTRHLTLPWHCDFGGTRLSMLWRPYPFHSLSICCPRQLLPDPASSLSIRATLCLEIPHLQMCLSNLPLGQLLTSPFSLDKIIPVLRESLSFWNSSSLAQTCGFHVHCIREKGIVEITAPGYWKVISVLRPLRIIKLK